MSAKVQTAITDAQKLEIEERKIKALEKIATSLEDLTLWVEEIDKDEWSERLQWYLSEYYNKYVKEDDDK
jgi:hypothetical protein|tara:strand:+ start:993 stop:1202 length:210 start_codon:yes stop_codon:yes gene_type:complete